ncbi:hypothetical protein L227DRAFT_390205 [Lentinus tigrinus ALCF2SS1-6]|uniref:Uncharacterized protein n=1 Tax=Lentinus tigrinus ALCF2SS1-6 TaxID=1328759 RepID=A0A5C2SIM7_9APHY|nr:hypothetical protein L227DRAFT_390205 [Lentinus tigrinus ALCF2SS1-6]
MPVYTIFHKLGTALTFVFCIPTRKRRSPENGNETWVKLPWRRLWTLIHASKHSTESPLKWRRRELALLSWWRQELDADMIASAYNTAMDTDYLHVATACMTELSYIAMTRCFRAIRSANIAHWGEEHVRSMRETAHPCTWSTAILVHMAVRKDDPSFKMLPAKVTVALDTAYEYIFQSNPRVDWNAPLTHLVLADFASIVYHYNICRLPKHMYDIKESLLRNQFQWLLEGAAEKGIGNDVREYIAFSCWKAALQGLTHEQRMRWTLSNASSFAYPLPHPRTPSLMIRGTRVYRLALLARWTPYQNS